MKNATESKLAIYLLAGILWVSGALSAQAQDNVSDRITGKWCFAFEQMLPHMPQSFQDTYEAYDADQQTQIKDRYRAKVMYFKADGVLETTDTNAENRIGRWALNAEETTLTITWADGQGFTHELVFLSENRMSLDHSGDNAYHLVLDKTE
ncbi:MAG: hypothetical protein AAFX87_12985 [Bacteroidota bacterium]